jgi:hypothetical protein
MMVILVEDDDEDEAQSSTGMSRVLFLHIINAELLVHSLSVCLSVCLLRSHGHGGGGGIWMNGNRDTSAG